MARAKPKATIMVADGVGGLARVDDRRFEPAADWPIHFEVSKEDADVWFRYFYAECGRRGWTSGGMGQLDARENSGSINVNTGGAETPQLAVVWEWKRGNVIKVRARSSGSVEFPVSDAEELFTQVSARCRARATERFYRRGQLCYEGLAWRGELWLDDTVRLGPPTMQYESAMYGPRVILVDVLVDCAGQTDSARAFDEKIRGLAAFLSVVLGTLVHLPKAKRTWTFETGADDCSVRSLGYFQRDNPPEMPARGTAMSTTLKLVSRPDFSLRGIDGSANEESVPADITDLWSAFGALESDQRRDFLQAAAKWQEALMHWGEQRTLSFALMVVACEALKPSGPGFKDHNVYHVVEALLGTSTANRLQEESCRPQNVRNAHLHRGEFWASEFLRDMMMSSYQDPTFDQAHRDLARITQESLIEWLRRRGVVILGAIKRKKSWRRWVKDKAFYLIPVVGGLGILAGFVFGWLLSSFGPS